MMSRQKEKEEFLLTEFLKFAKIRFQQIAMGDGPDAKVKCLFEGKWQTIGVELTEYQVDADQPGGSRARQICDFHQKLWTQVRQLLENRAHLCSLHCWIVYDPNNPPRHGKQKALADELITFLESKRHDVPLDGQRVPFDRQKGHFAEFEIMHSCVSKVVVHRTGANGPMSWDYANAANVGIVRRIIADRIGVKTNKSRSYDRSDVDQMWLLICASGQTSHDSAGPGWEPNRRRLNSPEILEAAAQSGFDRIVFWERYHEWQQDIPTTEEGRAAQ